MIKVESYSEAQDKKLFMERFGSIPEALYPKRPLPPAVYWSYLVSCFPEVEGEFFIATNGKKDVGRVGCNLSKGHPGSGFFGFFEADLSSPEAGTELALAALDWLKSKDARQVIGPIDYNVWMGNRFRISGQESVFSWEPNGPGQYVEIFESVGFNPSQGYISMVYDDSVISFERTKSAYDKALEQGFTFRNLDLNRPNEIDKLYSLNVKSFQINYMYEPISKEQYKALHIKAVESQDLQYSFFISTPEGKEAGYLYCFVEDGHLIVKSMLMDPDFQGARLASALLHASLKQARKNGILKAVGAMVRKGNVSQHFFDHLQTPVARNEYVMLKKEL